MRLPIHSWKSTLRRLGLRCWKAFRGIKEGSNRRTFHPRLEHLETRACPATLPSIELPLGEVSDPSNQLSIVEWSPDPSAPADSDASSSAGHGHGFAGR